MKIMKVVVLMCGVLVCGISCHAAKTTGNVHCIGVQVFFANYNDAPPASIMSNKFRSAKLQYEKFSLGAMNMTYETGFVQLPLDRNQYLGGALDDAVNNELVKQGYRLADFDIIAYFHGSHPSGNKGVVGGGKIWLSGNGGAMIHEMGHAFGWGHQKRWAAKPETDEPYDPIHSNGNSDVIDVWSFMTTGTVDTEVAEKVRAKWIPNYYFLKQNTNATVRLYNYDEFNATVPEGFRRAMRVKRSSGNKKYFWLGYRARQLKEVDSGGDPTDKDNKYFRQGLVFHWERADDATDARMSGTSPVALDLHYGADKNTNDQTLQPGETFSDSAGDVHITNLGRGGSAPNEYIDVQVNTGSFPGNQAPEPTWNAPYSLLKGESYDFVVNPHEPDGDPVSCMWKTTTAGVSVNTSSNVLRKSWNSTGSKKQYVWVSDMKGEVVKLSRTIEVVDAYPVSQWQGVGSNTVWNTASNWVSAAEPSTKLDIASWSEAFAGANQPVLNSNVLSRLVYQLSVESSLDKDVTLTLQETNNALKVYGGIDMSAADQKLSIVGDGSVWIQAWQPWVVSSNSSLRLEADLNMKANQLTVESDGAVELSGDVSGGGTLVKSGSGTLALRGGSLDVQNMILDAGGLSLGSAASIDAITITNNLILNGGGLMIDIDPAATPNCDRLQVLGTLGGTGGGALKVSNLGAATFSSGQIFQVFDQPYPAGATMAIEPAQPGPGWVWVNRLAIDGSIAVVPAPSEGTFDHWATMESGMFGPNAAFEADPNSDGLKNGLAYFLGAPVAREEASGYMPVWEVYPGSNVAFSVYYRRLDEATNQVYHAIEYTTNLTEWILAVDGQDGIVETVEDDYYGRGIDRVNVSLYEELAPGGMLYGRLVVLDRMSPEVVMPHYDAWAAGHGLTGADADPSKDVDGDGRTNVEEFLDGSSPAE